MLCLEELMKGRKTSVGVVAEIRTEYSRIQFLSDAICKTFLDVIF